MAYKALYRTYRPQTFDEVAGQQVIVQTLKNALAKGKIAHAYLFSGPRGTGKTTMAKLLAKALNCEEGIGHQCNHCSNCQAIIDGSHPDVIEIDAASNNGVENIRDLVDNVKYSPIKGRYKIYIIDEVHMMSASAFNALLKTLEEPPAHVIFILATTEPHKVLPTIVSRCQRFDFTKVSDIDIKARLKTVLEAEKVTADPAAIDMLISLADGGVRDALSMLDQLLSYAGNHLAEKDILNVFGLLDKRDKIALLKLILAGNLSSVMEQLADFETDGIDIRRLTSDLLSILKDVIVYQRTQDHGLLTVINEQDAETFNVLAEENRLLKMVDRLMKTENEYRFVNNARSLFEVSVMEMTINPQEDKLITNIQVPSNQTAKNDEPKKATEETIDKPNNMLEDNLVPEPIIEAKEEETPPKEPVAQQITKEEKVNKPTIPLSAHELHENKPMIQKKINQNVELQGVPIAETGETISMDEDTLIKVMCIGDRDEKLALINKWDQLKNYFADPELGHYAALLKDGQPYVLSKDILVLNYVHANRAQKVNIKENQPLLSALIHKIIGRKVVVYGVYDKNRASAQKKFMELSQLGRLPRARDIVIKIKGVNE